MTLVKWMAVTALGGAMVIGPSLSAPPAQAEGYTLTLAEIPNCISPGVGCNPYVTATGAGELDLTPLSLVTSGVTSPTMIPNGGAIITGPTGADQVNFFTGPITGPTSFGSGVAIAPEQGSGDTIGIGRGITSNGTSEFFFFDPAVGFGISGVSDFNSTSLFESNVGTTFSSLGVTPGTYVWSWGGAEDTFTLIIGGAGAAPVPEPSGLTLLGVGLAGMALAGLWRKRTLTSFEERSARVS